MLIRSSAGTGTRSKKRWVTAYNGIFHINWRGEDDNLYNRARTMLPEAGWDAATKSVTVPAVYHNEVDGFALEHEFLMTRAARELMENARRDYRRTIIPEVVQPKRK